MAKTYKLGHLFSPGLLLAGLHGERKFGHERAMIMQTVERLGKHNWTRSVPDDEFAQASATHQARLLEFVDDWIESGRTKEGGHDPRSRKLSANSEAAMKKWLKDPQPLWDVKPSGGVRVSFALAGKPTGNPIDEASAEAVREFVLLWESPLLYLIAKCQNEKCNRYFFREKLRSSKPRRGPFCPNCRKAASSNVIMRDKRFDKREEMLRAAASAMDAWPTLSEKTRSSYGNDVDAYMLQRVRRHENVTPKWVSRNQGAIEKARKGGN